MSEENKEKRPSSGLHNASKSENFKIVIDSLVDDIKAINERLDRLESEKIRKIKKDLGLLR